MDFEAGWGAEQIEGGDKLCSVGGVTVRTRGNESGDCDGGRNRGSLVKML